ncbi:MAG: DNA alkylation repair protein [Rikenellaceae bacterium]
MKNEYEYKKILLLDKLRRQMNGAVVDAMRDYNGLENLRSYGVSLPTIKDICLESEKEHELALYLFESNVRELKLCAIFLDEPEKIEPSQIDKWSSECSNNEIMSHMAHLFEKSRYVDEYFHRWIESDSPAFVRMALLMIGGLARESKVIANSKEKIVANIDKCTFFTLNSFVYAITNILIINPDWQAEILHVVSGSNVGAVNELNNFL